MVGFVRTGRWEIRLLRKSFKITHNFKREISKPIFQGSKITITTEGYRRLRPVIGSKTFKESEIQELASKWCEKLTKSSEIEKTQQQAVYAAFTSRYKHKFSCSCEQLITSATSCPR